MAEGVAKDWPSSDVSRLEDLWARGLTATAIAEELGRTKSAVLGKVHRLGLDQRKAGKRASNCPDTRSAKRPAMRPLNPPAHPWKDSRPERGPDKSKLPQFRGQPLEGSIPKPLMARGFGECAWPIGEEGEPVLSCCLPVSRGSYCRAHGAMAYVKPINPRHLVVVPK